MVDGQEECSCTVECNALWADFLQAVLKLKIACSQSCIWYVSPRLVVATCARVRNSVAAGWERYCRTTNTSYLPAVSQFGVSRAGVAQGRFSFCLPDCRRNACFPKPAVACASHGCTKCYHKCLLYCFLGLSQLCEHTMTSTERHHLRSRGVARLQLAFSLVTLLANGVNIWPSLGLSAR